MSEIDRDLSETSDDEDLRFFENLQESFAEEKARGGIFVEQNSDILVEQNREFLVEQNSDFLVEQNREFLVEQNSDFLVEQNYDFLVEQNRGFLVDQNRRIVVDLRSELIKCDPNVFRGQTEHSREEFRIMLSVLFTFEVLKF